MFPHVGHVEDSSILLAWWHRPLLPYCGKLHVAFLQEFVMLTSVKCPLYFPRAFFRKRPKVFEDKRDLDLPKKLLMPKANSSLPISGLHAFLRSTLQLDLRYKKLFQAFSAFLRILAMAMCAAARSHVKNQFIQQRWTATVSHQGCCRWTKWHALNQNVLTFVSRCSLRVLGHARRIRKKSSKIHKQSPSFPPKFNTIPNTLN